MPPVVQRIRVSIQIKLEYVPRHSADGLQNADLLEPFPYRRQDRVYHADHGNQNRYDGYREHHDLSRGNELHDGIFHLCQAHDLDIRELIQLFLKAGAVNTLFQFDADRGDFVGSVEYLLRSLEGHKDRPVILRACPLQYTDHLELDVLLGHEDLVADFTLFKFGRLITHNSLIGVCRR